MTHSTLEPINKSIQAAIILPAYNEATTIKDVIEKIICLFDGLIIVIDDGSTDNTNAIVQQLPVVLLTHLENKGKAQSLMTGFQHAIAKGVTSLITIDADGQHDPAEIPRLISACESHPNTIIIAARLLERENAPRNRLLANHIADFWISWAAGHKIIDSQSGFRLYPASLIEKIQPSIKNNVGFVFESEIFIKAKNLNYGIYSIPVKSIYQSDRRKSHYHPIKDSWLITKMVAGQLLRRGFYLKGLYHSLFNKK